MNMKPLFGLRDIFAPARDENIIRSLLDIDMYKFTMGQFINSRKSWRDIEVTFTLIVRTKGLKLATVIPFNELLEQLSIARELRMTPAEVSYMRGLPLGDGYLFNQGYISFLESYRLPAFNLSSRNGDFVLTFTGPWGMYTYWETIAMSIISELYYWNLVKNGYLNASQIMAMYAGMFARVQKAAEVIRTTSLKFVDFGTRRRHSFDNQEITLGLLKELLPYNYAGTSNVLMSMRQGSDNPMGTNAHELPMAMANMTEHDSDEEIRESQYEVVREWAKMYPQLTIMLPDTFGTTQFLNGAPESFATDYVGIRLDSKEPHEATEESIRWWVKHSVDPKTKTLIPSDGLTPEKMVELHNAHGGRVNKYTFGIGTFLTNNCAGLWPTQQDPGFGPFSMVVKLKEVNGMSAVKLSDNPQKVIGGDRAERFKKIFGTDGFSNRMVVV